MNNFSKNIINLSGAPDGFDANILSNFISEKQKSIIFVARDDKRLDLMRKSLWFFSPNIPVLNFPSWDCLPYDRVSPNADVSSARMATLAALSSGFEAPLVLLTTLNAITQYIPNRTIVSNNSFVAIVGRTINVKELRSYFSKMGFVQTPTVTEPGDYAIRGGIIDVFPPGEIGPVRMDLFGDELESARRFDPVTQRTVENLDRIEFAPVSEVILDDVSINRFRNNYRKEFGSAGLDDPLYEAVSAGRKHQGYEHWAPYFHDGMETIFDHLPNAVIFMDENIERIHNSRWDGINDQYEARLEALNLKNRLETVYKPIKPELFYISPDDLFDLLNNREQRKFIVLPQPTGPNSLDMRARIGRNFAPERQNEELGLFEEFAKHIIEKRKTTSVIIASMSLGARERLYGLLQDQGLSGMVNIKTWKDINHAIGSISLAVWHLEHGFEAPGLTIISEQDVLGELIIRKTNKKRRAKDFLTEASSLSVGDLVVHVDHGVGRYRGLETVKAAGAPHDCLLLEYANNDRLYLPVENVELLSRYGHETGLLDRLGGSAWQAKKAKLKERIREMADKLLRIAAERSLRKSEILEVSPDKWNAFCARFPYVETDDQLNAIEDVVSDMSSGKPMDRLICGDVGFGKTEVALRAAFIAASAGTQVAIIAPTTLLVRQHFKSFEERFRGTGIRVKQLSRFVTTSQMKKNREALRDGAVEIIIGTHALLAKDIKFANLGLLIIDEEQKFGVGHKERLKQLRSDIHVLTLTATPIPRTLQLSLSGVRELSVIGTPPIDRLAIRTYVSEFDTVTLREALLREHYRGGQSFFVVPRISDLPEVEAFIEEQVPEINHVVAHGQMPAGELDERMNAFYDGKFGILVATTIVESGLDIPAANTIIIHRADMFGLSQLYQIRGRVGRSKTRAYAYLTTKPRQKLTHAAIKRLRVLGSLDSLGAGFMLASQDLDIRGAGNILGEEQSGNVREVGYELYQEMLEDAIAKIKSGQMEGLTDEGSWSPQINLGVPVLIPEAYVQDLDVRLGLYRRLSALAKKIELEAFAAELIDRFGKLPTEVDMLLRVVRIKGMCRAAGIAKLDSGPKGAVIQFYQDKFISPSGLAQYLLDSRGTAKIKDNKLIVLRDWTNDDKKIKGAYIIARELAVMAKNQKTN
ncbi:transcription-repair coupling factor [Amylibacter sp.]|nr:transcription-repair coupling factor [Amylibacter sp.]MDB0034912.1 transcription-repair coupling factor [Amylibacter sp.]MDB9728031.1 transcription-repair coupling factor [Amylibacter sp.]MDC0488052.1 transcription-repair coupling factor [Amylibacter sp.]